MPLRMRWITPSMSLRWSIRPVPKRAGGSYSSNTSSTFSHNASHTLQIVGSASAGFFRRAIRGPFRQRQLRYHGRLEWFLNPMITGFPI
jgi:hypothetical protein